jgi:SAM-dependent methyltransferase
MNDYEIETDEYLKHGINLFQHALFAPTETDHIRIYNHYVRPRGVVVDLGCGIGETAHLLSRVNRDCKFINVTNCQRQTEIMASLNRPFLLNDFHATSLHDKSADLVLMNESLGYADLSLIMKEVVRILKDGGVFILKDFVPAINIGDVMRLDEWETNVFPYSQILAKAEECGLLLSWSFKPQVYTKRSEQFVKNSRMKEWHKTTRYPTNVCLMKFEKVAE